MAPKIHVYPSSLVLYLRFGFIGFYYCMKSDNNMQIYFWHVDILFSHHLLQELHSLNSSWSWHTCKGFCLDISVCSMFCVSMLMSVVNARTLCGVFGNENIWILQPFSSLFFFSFSFMFWLFSILFISLWILRSACHFIQGN